MARLSDISDSFGLAKGIFTPPVHLAKIRTMIQQNLLDVPPKWTKKIRFMLKNNFFCLFLFIAMFTWRINMFCINFFCSTNLFHWSTLSMACTAPLFVWASPCHLSFLVCKMSKRNINPGVLCNVLFIAFSFRMWPACFYCCTGEAEGGGGGKMGLQRSSRGSRLCFVGVAWNISPIRGTNSKRRHYLLSYFFGKNLNGTAKAPTVDLLR